MAISKMLPKDENEYKIDFEEVYYKIDEMWIEPVRNEVRIGVRGYPNEYSRENGGIGIDKKVFTIQLDELKIKGTDKESLIKAGYSYIKTLPEFKDGQDI